MAAVRRKAVRKNAFVTFLYPLHGIKNILKKRQGIVEKTGTGPNGKYFILNMGDAGFRTFRRDRAINLQVS